MNELHYGPRERLLQLGEPSLSHAECLALLLRTGVVGVPAEQMAQRLLRTFGGLPGLAAATPREVAAQPGVGAVRAAALTAGFGLARRLAESRLRPGTQILNAAQVAMVVREAARGTQRETFYAALLDGKNRVLGLRIVSQGSLMQAPVHPREVFVAAIREGAAALVLAHNHPSGDPTPSADDRAVTDRLRQVGELVGIEVLDHVVVGHETFYSFAEQGCFPLGAHHPVHADSR